MKSRFVIVFCVLVLLLYVFVALNPINDTLVEPFTHFVAVASSSLLRAVGEEVQVTGTIMRSTSFALEVKNGCNAIDASIIFLASVLAFPASLRSRSIGAICGLMLLNALNIVRLASLFALGVHFRQLFDFFHVAVMQAVFIAVSVGIFFIWSSRFAQRRSSPAG